MKGISIEFGHCPAELALDRLRLGNPEALFDSAVGFSRARGQNLIVRGEGLDLKNITHAVQSITARHLYLSDPKVFVQSEGAGLELHGDPVAVVAWQLAGRKLWRLYDSDQFPAEMRSLRLAQESVGVGPVLTHFYQTSNFKVHCERELVPGSFVVMPKFTLHETFAITPGLSISFTINCEAA